VKAVSGGPRGVAKALSTAHSMWPRHAVQAYVETLARLGVGRSCTTAGHAPSFAWCSPRPVRTCDRGTTPRPRGPSRSRPAATPPGARGGAGQRACRDARVRRDLHRLPALQISTACYDAFGDIGAIFGSLDGTRQSFSGERCRTLQTHRRVARVVANAQAAGPTLMRPLTAAHCWSAFASISVIDARRLRRWLCAAAHAALNRRAAPRCEESP
jgi:hypothetical protein